MKFVLKLGGLNQCVVLLSRAFISAYFTQKEQFSYLPQRDFRANEETHLKVLPGLSLMERSDLGVKADQKWK